MSNDTNPPAMTDEQFKLGVMQTLADIIWDLENHGRWTERSAQRFRDFANTFYQSL